MPSRKPKPRASKATPKPTSNKRPNTSKVTPKPTSKVAPKPKATPRRDAFDLNDATPRSRRKLAYQWTQRQRGGASGPVAVHFGDLADALIAFIRGSEELVACVAWVSSLDVLDALEHCRRVAIIVNKEPALRDATAMPRNRYGNLPGGFRTTDFPAPLNELGDHPLDPVRCTGHAPRIQTANTPLMHHKFAVRLEGGEPVAVWTGSFNWTRNASSSIENAVEIHDPAIAALYLAEFSRVAALSEPLDYKTGKFDAAW